MMNRLERLETRFSLPAFGSRFRRMEGFVSDREPFTKAASFFILLESLGAVGTAVIARSAQLGGIADISIYGRIVENLPGTTAIAIPCSVIIGFIYNYARRNPTS